jgi:hypothetical protein
MVVENCILCMSRVVLRHVLKVSDEGERRRKDEGASKLSSKGKKKSARKMKPRHVVEEEEFQAIIRDMLQVLPMCACFLMRTSR